MIETMAPSSLHTRRNNAYFVALAMHALTTAMAMLVWAFGLSSAFTDGLVAAAIFVSGLTGGILMIRAGCTLAVLPFFMIGAGIFFGLGTVITVASPAEMATISFTEDAQRETLSKVTATHSLAMLIVVACAGPFLVFLRDEGNDGRGLRDTLDAFGRYFGFLLATSVFICLIQWLTFPRPSSLPVVSLINMLRGVPLITLIMAGAIWPRLDGQARVLAITIMLSSAVYGLLQLTKLYALLPIVTFALGFVLGGRGRWVVLGIMLGCFVFYFGILAELVRFARSHVSYDPELNSVMVRVTILIQVFNESILMQGNMEDQNLLLRLTLVPFAAYFMNLYDSGFPGDSLDLAFAVLIPRLLWPDKPLITPGSDFDLIWRGHADISNLAIGPVAEGYYNLGWPGVLLVSVLIGVQVGWFTRKWVLFTRYGMPHLGVFLLSPALIRAFGHAESNVVGAYIGGTAQSAILIMLIDVVVRSYRGHREARIADG